MKDNQGGLGNFLWIMLIVLAVTGGLIFLLVKFGGSVSTNGGDAVLSTPVNANDWSKGNLESVTILLEYGDFQCPACGQFYPIVEEIVNKNKDSMRFVYRQFPLRQVHQNADLASRASEAAGRQGKFWEMYGLLFKNQTAWSNQSNTEDIFIGYALSLGLDLVKFEKDLDDPGIKEKINADLDSGFKSRVNGTPTFFLNGKLMNYSGLADFQGQIDQSINANK